MISALFPAGVTTVVADSQTWQGALYPEEARCIARAATKRRREFTTGRLCAKKALSYLGLTSFPLLVGVGRAPVWPRGIIGSISHCEGFCGVAVARQCGEILGIGLDVEVAGALDASVADLVCTSREQRWCLAAPPPGVGDWAKIIFSAKESVYKCLFPFTGLFLEFGDVELDIDREAMSFSAQLGPRLRAQLPGVIYGRIALDECYVYTGAVLRGTQ